MGLFRPYQPKTGADRAQASVTEAPAAQAEQAGQAEGEGEWPVLPEGVTTPEAADPAPAEPAAAIAAEAAPAAPAKTKIRARGKGQGEWPLTPEPAPRQAVRKVTTIERPAAHAKKAAPTPTRKQALAARQERLNPVLTKKQARAKERQAREKARLEGTQKLHDQPVMTMIRDYVDCRWLVAEFILPVVLIIVFIPMLVASAPLVMTVALISSMSLYAIMMVQLFWMWRGLRKLIFQYFPNEPLKGKMSYATSRAMMLRRWRQPKPQVARGTKFTWPRDQQLR